MKNNSLKALFIFNGIFVFAGALLGPMYAVFVETIDPSIFSISISWSAFLISTTIFMIMIRKFGDSVFEKEYLLLAGYLIRSIAWFYFPFISIIIELVFLQILLGLGEALGTPSFDAIFAQHLDKGKEIKEYSEWKLITNIGGAIAVIIGSFIVNYFGFNFLFFLMGSLSLISFFGILIKPRDLL